MSKKSFGGDGAVASTHGVSGQRLVDALEDACPKLSGVGSCQALGISRATYYRMRKAKPAPKNDTSLPRACRVPGRALTPELQQAVLDQLHSDRFRDKAPPQVYDRFPAWKYGFPVLNHHVMIQEIKNAPTASV